MFAISSLGILTALSGASARGGTKSPSAELQFNRDIRPILSDRCFKCHGPDKNSRKANLRLDMADSAYAQSKKSDGFPIVPGKPEQSLVCKRIFSTDEDEMMPPPASNLKLSAAEKEKIKLWIAQGAKYQPHWAFIPAPDKVEVPEVKNRKWARNEIDRFILARLEKEGIKPSPEASKVRWLRRVTYDLTGLPPKPEEVDAFLKDKSKDAYGKVADRLLASKHFGERMAVPWLDAARYADSYGYQSDQLCPTWPYRDWVVQAFNDDMPFNEFLTEQLAGDLLPHATREQRLATAFNRLHRMTGEGGSIEDEWRSEYVSDRVNTFSTVFLGLTMECSRCHDHKYDPLTQRDYYSLESFFNSIDEYGLYNDTARVPTPSLLLPTAEQEKAMAGTAQELKEKTEQLNKVEADVEGEFEKWLKRPEIKAEIPGLAGEFNFDKPTTNNTFANAVNATNFSTGIGGNTLAAGKSGKALKFTGDDEVSFPGIAGSLQPWEQYTAVFRLYLPKELTNAVIFHRTEGTDVGFHGTELSLEGGKLFYVIKRFWPGNAIAVRSMDNVPADEWTQIGVSYDGSGDAGGMRLYINGRPAKTEMVRNHLFKSPENGGSGLTFGARFRSSGLKDGMLDELRVYGRPLAPIEVAQLFDGRALEDAIHQQNADALREYYFSAVSSEVRSARGAVAEAEKHFLETRNPVREISVMEETPTLRATYVLARGRYDAPKTEDKRVGRATPKVLPAFPAGAPDNRLGLAEWLTDPRHPLTARVEVNRLWQMIFGRGIVATTENFGVQGSPPTHPELLDWLARDFVNSGWDVKALLKKIVLSATYRQDSKMRKDLLEKDPENLLLARAPSHRLPAEMIRDTALAVSGLLDEEMGGPPVSPRTPGDLWRESNTMSPAYTQSVGRNLYRRSLYTVVKRTAPMPDMTAFDVPSREVCVVKRSATGTPQQAFVLLNDSQFVEAMRVLAEKALKEGGATEEERIRFCFRRLTAREPERKEAALLKDLLDEQRGLFKKEPDRAEKLTSVGDEPRDKSLDVAELAAMTTVAQAILNLDATIWKR